MPSLGLGLPSLPPALERFFAACICGMFLVSLFTRHQYGSARYFEREEDESRCCFTLTGLYTLAFHVMKDRMSRFTEYKESTQRSDLWPEPKKRGQSRIWADYDDSSS